MSVEQDNSKEPANNYPGWCPRFWHGMRTPVWWRLLAENRFRVAPSRLPMALAVTVFTPLNDLLAAIQWLVFERKIARTEPAKPPLFILGHWRSGTTLLHELMVSDPQFASPSTFQCFAPSHHLISEYLMVRFGGFLLPKKRPMDDMHAGWELPQEDEFALMNLGAPTPYLRIAFPRTQPHALEYLSMQGIPATQLGRWSRALTWFIKSLSVRYPGQQLVMKSPPHTGRLAHLAKLYPDAKFVHLTRDPRKLFLSTIRLWDSLEKVQAFQLSPSEENRKQYVAECLQRMYSSFEAARTTLDPSRVVDVRYEDLVADPMATLRFVYDELQLGDFDEVAPHVEKRLENHEDYQPNRHAIDESLENEILSHWSDYATRYGYARAEAKA